MHSSPDGFATGKDENLDWFAEHVVTKETKKNYAV